MKRLSTRHLYSAVFATMLVFGLVKAVKRCSLRMTSAWNRTLDRFAYGDYRTTYYVGIKLDAFSGYRNHRVLWQETETSSKKMAEAYRDYIIRHIPAFDGKLFIRKVSPIHDGGDNMIPLTYTPFIPAAYQSLLTTFSSLLGAGRLIRASYEYTTGA